MSSSPQPFVIAQDLTGSDFHRHGIEACDLLGPDDELIHVKRLRGSDDASHLFSQGLVSVSALILDGQARIKFEAWAPTYDAVFYCCDRFAQHQAGDPYRSKVLDLQSAADRVVRSTCATVGQRVIDIPPNMTTAERVRWIAARVAKLGITRDAPAAS